MTERPTRHPGFPLNASVAAALIMLEVTLEKKAIEEQKAERSALRCNGVPVRGEVR
jgi:hypothetical protein